MFNASYGQFESSIRPPNFYMGENWPGVDGSNDSRKFSRIGNIDIRTKDKLNEDGLAYSTHSGVGVLEFQKGDQVAIAVSVSNDYIKGKEN